MKLSQAKLNCKCIIKSVDIKDEKTKFRLLELGLIEGCEIYVSRKSIFKKTLIVIFCASCFTLKEDVAQGIEVAYA